MAYITHVKISHYIYNKKYPKQKKQIQKIQTNIKKFLEETQKSNRTKVSTNPKFGKKVIKVVLCINVFFFGYFNSVIFHCVI